MSEREPKPQEKDHGGDEESFLERWSRRKQAVQRQSTDNPDRDHEGKDGEGVAQADEDHRAAPATLAETGIAGDIPVEPEPPGDEDMPPLETIDEGGSLSAFFSPKVSAGLRRAALKRLFSQPEYNVVDMLDDYALDYSKREPLGDIVTAEMRYRAEQARKLVERKLKAKLDAETDPEARAALIESIEANAADAEAPDEAASDEALARQADADASTDTTTDDLPDDGSEDQARNV